MATIYNKEREDFYQKYRIFQLHKWEILKVVKQRMLEEKIKEVQRARMVRAWIVHAAVRRTVQRVFEVFDRERFMIAHRKKMMPIIFRIRRRLRKRVLQYGGPLEERLRRRDVRGSNAALMAGCLRPVLRERAKHTLLAFLQGGADRAFMAAKF